MNILMTQRHYEFIADNLAPLMPWPSYIVEMSKKLKETNPKFNKEKFLSRAITAWELQNPQDEEELDDHIPDWKAEDTYTYLYCQSCEISFDENEMHFNSEEDGGYCPMCRGDDLKYYSTNGESK